MMNMNQQNETFIWQDVLDGLHSRAHQRACDKACNSGNVKVMAAKIIAGKTTASQSTAPRARRKKYPVGRQFPGIFLAQREAECIYWLLQGNRYKQIGVVMNVSLRTVETYIKNIRAKLRCNKKAEIIAIIEASEFLQHFKFNPER